MADDVEAMSGDEGEVVDRETNMEVVSTSNLISSTDTRSESVIDVVSTGDRPRDVENSMDSEVDNSNVCVSVDTRVDVQQCSDCSSSCVQQAPQNLCINEPVSTLNVCDGNICDASSSETVMIAGSEANGDCQSDVESEIIVDDSPLPATACIDRVGSSTSNMAEDKDTHIIDNGNEVSESLFAHSRSATPSPSYIRLGTPSTPGTPRLRSGSVSGTTYAPLSPKPSPSSRATPGERQRAGSMGEIEMRDKMIGREFKEGIRIIDNLDILQLPRPRNPGGILPLNGHNSFNSPNEALNLSLDDGQKVKPRLGDMQSVNAFTPVVSMSTLKRPNTSYLISNIIRTTPTRLRVSNTTTAATFGSLTSRSQGCAINESVERPLPSSVVDSEGVAKKIARLDSEGFLCTSTGDSLWDQAGRADTSNEHLSRVRVISDKTPPERPKPPRRTVLSPADNGSIDMSHDRSFVSSSVRRRLSPAHLHTSLISGVTSTNGHSNGGLYETSPADEIYQQPHHYKCRMCNYSSSSYNLLQMHSTKHGGNGKTFRCSLCDYSTYEKSNFRRHRRLHHKTLPLNVLKCVKCAFVTSLPRKLREHYPQAHPDMPDLAESTLEPGVPRNVASPPQYTGSQGLPAESTSSYPGQFYDNPLLQNRTDRLGYPYSVTGRQPSLNFPLDQYGMPYGNYRVRHADNLASNYLRSIVSSIMNSESSRQAATSTVTSSNYYMPSGIDDTHPIQDIHTCSNHGSCQHANCSGVHSGIKIKIETDTDNASDISSTAHSGSVATPDMSRNITDGRTHQPSDTISSNMNTISNGTGGPALHIQSIMRHRGEDGMIARNQIYDIPTDLSSPRKSHIVSDTFSQSGGLLRVNIDLNNGSEMNHGNAVLSPPPSGTIIKSDITTRGIQCVLPVIKTEVDLDGDYYDFCGRPRFRGVDRAVQCNINLSTTSTVNSRSQCPATRTSFRSQSISESDASEHHSSVCSESRCDYCGISFDDEVLFSIHLGCHSHTDPFKCNVCGKQCGNKYGFYSHIMRGHQL